MAALTCVPWVYGLISQETTAIDAIFYGGPLPDGNYYITPVMRDTKPGRKIMGVIFHYRGDVDVLDIKGLQKSEPHDYVKGQNVFIITPDDQFRSEVQKGYVGTNYFLFDVPDTMTKESFVTIRQAERDGAKIISKNSKTP